MTPQPHHHTTLNHNTAEFRLVTFSETKDGALRARLHIFPISQCPPYTAISYTWGTEPPRRTIYLNGEKTRIRENIYQALQSILRLRRRNEQSKQKIDPLEEGVSLQGLEKNAAENEFFWIDSICINQANVEERNHQVGMMGRIFSNAELMIAWLGRESDRSIEIMQAIRNYQADPRPIPLALGNPKQLPPDLDALVDIFGSLTYWSRLWIVQEIVLAREILVGWGNEFVTWDRITTIGLCRAGRVPIRFNITYEHAVQFTNEYDENWVKLVHEKGRRSIFLEAPEKAITGAGSLKPATLYSLFVSFVSHGCMEPRDKIIGLLGLVSEDAAHLADYSMPTNEFFLEVCKYAFRTGPIKGDNTKFRFQNLLGKVLGLSWFESSMRI